MITVAFAESDLIVYSTSNIVLPSWDRVIIIIYFASESLQCVYTILSIHIMYISIIGPLTECLNMY